MTGDGRDPLRSGLFRSVRQKGWRIDPEKWAAAVASGELVGHCRRPGCDGFLVADDPPADSSGIRPVDYTARCLLCDAEIVAPGGRVLHRSGRHGEAPDFYNQRAERLKRN